MSRAVPEMAAGWGYPTYSYRAYPGYYGLHVRVVTSLRWAALPSHRAAARRAMRHPCGLSRSATAAAGQTLPFPQGPQDLEA